MSDNTQPWFIFLEVLPPDLPSVSLPTFDKDQDVVLFFKYYCPRTKKVGVYCIPRGGAIPGCLVD